MIRETQVQVCDWEAGSSVAWSFTKRCSRWGGSSAFNSFVDRFPERIIFHENGLKRPVGLLDEVFQKEFAELTAGLVKD
jgi:hypothetical protein